MEPVRPRASDGVHTRLYIMLVLLAALGGYAYTLRSDALFSCPATGYGEDRYLAYCHAAQYGDYDHGAFWFSLEPEIRDYVRRAQVLFLGNSRVQFGFSGSTTRERMGGFSASYFLMGFAYWENYTFERALLAQIRPQARLYVINMDDFFDTKQTEVAKAVMQNDDLLGHYRIKRLWQRPHRWLCGSWSRLCGGNEAFFRSLTSGDYERFADKSDRVPVAYDDVVDAKVVADYAPRATQFFSELPVDRRCLLITIVPSSKTRIATAQAFADRLGLTLIAPRMTDLTTFDRSHLDSASAQRWAGAFFDAAAPRIRECLASATAGT